MSSSGGEDSSSSSGGVIAGVVVGIVVCIIVVALLLILLVWYKRRQRRMRSNNKSTQGNLYLANIKIQMFHKSLWLIFGHFIMNIYVYSIIVYNTLDNSYQGIKYFW